MTTRFNRFVVLFVIALIAMLLSACGGISDTINVAFQASDDAPASVQTLKASERIEACGLGDLQILINKMRADASDETGTVAGVSIGAWLDHEMIGHGCITR